MSAFAILVAAAASLSGPPDPAVPWSPTPPPRPSMHFEGIWQRPLSLDRDARVLVGDRLLGFAGSRAGTTDGLSLFLLDRDRGRVLSRIAAPGAQTTVVRDGDDDLMVVWRRPGEVEEADKTPCGLAAYDPRRLRTVWRHRACDFLDPADDRRLAVARAGKRLLGSGLSRANPPEPPNRITYAGDLIGVAGDVVVLGGTGDVLRGRDIQAFAARDGRPLRRSTRLPRAFVAQPAGRLLTVGNLLLGETPHSDGGITFFDLHADAIRFQLSARALAYRRSFPPVALGLPAAVGREQDGTVVVIVASSRTRCAVAIEAREIKSGSVRWHWSPPGPCWAVTAATGGDRVFIHAGQSIHAVSLGTGKPLWQMPSGCSDAPDCLAALATDGRHVGLAIGHKTLTVFAANTGAVIGQVPCDLFYPVVTVENGHACVSGTSLGRAAETTVTCVNADGRRSWTGKVAGALRNLELGGDTLYVAAGGGVRAYDAASGDIRWLFGGDRVALAHLTDGVRVVLGTDRMGALVLAEGAAPEAPRELTVTGVVSVRPDYEGAAVPPARAVTIQVAGTSFHPDISGRYRAVLKLSGGRIAIAACGCRTCTASSYIAVDERSTYEKDLAFSDSCRD